jgi:segregation and condensation protein B
MVEALLFSSETPLAAPRLAELTGLSRGDVLESIDRLNVAYAESGRSFRIANVALGFQLVTNPEFAPVLSKLHAERIPSRLSRAALETLAIIAFKQPVTRAEVDAIRGVSASDRVLRHLLERKTIRIAGRAEAPGRPLLYGTTREFLEYFGLGSLSDLPRTDELEALLAGDRPAAAASLFEDEEDVGLDAPGVALASERGIPETIDEDDEDEGELGDAISPGLDAEAERLT